MHAGKATVDKQFASLFPLFGLLVEEKDTAQERTKLMNELKILHNPCVFVSSNTILWTIPDGAFTVNDK